MGLLQALTPKTSSSLSIHSSKIMMHQQPHSPFTIIHPLFHSLLIYTLPPVFLSGHTVVQFLLVALSASTLPNDALVITQDSGPKPYELSWVFTKHSSVQTSGDIFILQAEFTARKRQRRQLLTSERGRGRQSHGINSILALSHLFTTFDIRRTFRTALMTLFIFVESLSCDCTVVVRFRASKTSRN